MISKRLNSLLTLVLLFSTLSIGIAQPSADEGKQLFKANCAQCHAKNMKADATGPALGGVEERWADYPREDLLNWIKNSGLMVSNGHPRAVEIYNEWNKSQMQAFPNLTDDNIESILLFINGTYDGTYGAQAVVSVATESEGEEKSNNLVFYLLFAVLAGLAALLYNIIRRLNQVAAAKEGVHYEGRTLIEALTSKGVITFALFVLVVLGGYATVNNATNLGRQEGYAPEQPIKFSHETHAGVHQIDCQYCHDGARRSKHSNIPAANTCMNCHRAIKVGSTYGTQELTKIYASIGYDPSTNTYIDNYDSMSEDDIKAVYTKWFSDQYLVAEDLTDMDSRGEKLINQQWDGLVSSLTNEQKTKIQGPIEWKRIHNLPDHVYFNHSQHVTVGEVECQTCHGKVEEMEVLAQAAPLSMGWCVNCHRQTEVKFKGNEYYESYSNYHNEMADGKRDKVTVEEIGGLECQKCHY